MDIKEIYERQGKRVYCIAMLYLKNKEDAEDAVQNVFIKFMDIYKIGPRGKKS